jgi:hypothetical protein
MYFFQVNASPEIVRQGAQETSRVDSTRGSLLCVQHQDGICRKHDSSSAGIDISINETHFDNFLT